MGKFWVCLKHCLKVALPFRPPTNVFHRTHLDCRIFPEKQQKSFVMSRLKSCYIVKYRKHLLCSGRIKCQNCTLLFIPRFKYITYTLIYFENNQPAVTRLCKLCAKEETSQIITELEESQSMETSLKMKTSNWSTLDQESSPWPMPDQTQMGHSSSCAPLKLDGWMASMSSLDLLLRLMEH